MGSRGVPSSKQQILEAIKLASARFEDVMKQVFSLGLPTCPAQLVDLELKLHHEVSRECVDAVVAAVITAAHDSVEVAVEEAVVVARTPHLRVQKSSQPVTFTLYGGSSMTLNTRYYLSRPPTRRGPKRKKGQRGKQGNGVYGKLACLGIHFRVTPALASEVGRLVALGTVQQAVDALAYRGVVLDGKAVSRLAQCLGERGLRYREWLQKQQEAPRSSDWAHGRRIGIGIDGGRLRTRIANRGARRKSGHRGFTAAWREPKVLTVYAFGANRRRIKKAGVFYDATLEDADGVFNLLVTLLKRLGADQAEEWVVLGDGAPWIWERIGDLVKRVGFDTERVAEVLDFYHACEHLTEAASVVTRWNEKDQKTWYNRLKWLLRTGGIDNMIEEIEAEYAHSKPVDGDRILNYFRTHRKRMDYAAFRKRRIPIGSGAVESAVRRVVNLRLKGNGIFWCPRNAEAVLHMRAQFLSGTWKDFVSTVLQHEAFWGERNPSQRAQSSGSAELEDAA